jgi:hypothetical protein
MMSRQEIQDLLLTLAPNVYFQGPDNVDMQYPCIVYHLNKQVKKHANNEAYKRDDGYLVTVIDRDPDSAIADSVSRLPKARFDRFFTADKLNHFAYAIFF